MPTHGNSRKAKLRNGADNLGAPLMACELVAASIIGRAIRIMALHEYFTFALLGGSDRKPQLEGNLGHRKKEFHPPTSSLGLHIFCAQTQENSIHVAFIVSMQTWHGKSIKCIQICLFSLH